MQHLTNRRTFLKSTLASAAMAGAGMSIGCASQRRASISDAVRRGVIDTHTHFYDPTRPQGVPWPSPKDPTLYRRVMPDEFRTLTAPFGVTGTVIVEASPWVEDNQWLLDLAHDDPFVLGIVGNLEPGKPEFKQHLARFTRDDLFRGIRINQKLVAESLASESFINDMQRLADADREVDLLGGATMLPDALTLTQRVPRLRIVIDHFPFEDPSDAAQRKAADDAFVELGKQPNVFVKVSNVLRMVDGKAVTDLAYYRDRLDRIWRRFGPDHVIYGSNWPVSDKVAPYAAVFGVMHDFMQTVDAAARDKYYRLNAIRAYGGKRLTARA